MTATFFKKYWLILISCCGLGGAAIACASDWTAEYGTSNFTPEIFVDSTYSPFLFSGQFYYGIGHDEAQNTRFDEDNVRAWTGYLTPRLNETAIRMLLDSTSARGIDSAAARYGGTDRVSAFFKYLRLAKRCESFAVLVRDSWYDTTKPKPFTDTLRLHRALKEGFTAAPDRFIKERYWFQWVRSCYFNGAPREAIKLYTAYSPLFPSDDVHYRTMSYMAGAYNKLHDYSHANYFYSLVFDSCVALRTTAHYSFHPQEEKDWRETLGLCTTTEQRITLWQMLGIFYQDPQRAIREIYALAPGSDKLDVLLSRAVNESEQRFGDGSTGFVDHPQVSDSLNRTLASLVGRIADAGNTAKPWVWRLAAGYLATLDGRFGEADAWLAKARKGLPADTLAEAQYRLLVLINRVSETPGAPRKLEGFLTPELEWLQRMQRSSTFRCADALIWLKGVMSKRYLAAGDRVKAECFVSSPTFYTDDKNVEALKAFLNKPDKSPFEALCARLSEKSTEDLYEYQAIRLCLKDSIDEALGALRHTDHAGETVLPGNPFNARINDCHDCDHEAAQKIKYTKMSFLGKLAELKTKIAAGIDVYTNAVLLGNAHYNITQFGNARAFFECNVIGEGGDSEPELINDAFRDPLVSMDMAEHYYTLALGAAATDEQKAKCQYLLSKCQRNDWYLRKYFNDPNLDEYDVGKRTFIAWDGFKALRQYAQTQYYKEVLRECGYFKTYIAENPGR